MRTLLYEILEEVGKAETRKEKIDILQKNRDNTALKEYLKIGVDKNVKLNLPEGDPPYKESAVPVGMGDTNLYVELRRIRNFIVGSPAEYKFDALKKESIFIGILEGLQKEEAKFLLDVKDKRLNKVYKGVTAKLVAEAFPDLNITE